MLSNEVLAYCLAKPGAVLTHPFGPDSDIVKVEGRIFAQIFQLNGTWHVTLNCDAVSGQFYRDLMPGTIVRGYHCPPVQQPYFSTMPIEAVADTLLIELMDHSYRTVVQKLPKYKQRGILHDT